MNDIMFFIKSYKQQSSHFNVTEYVQFISSNTRFGLSEKMIHHRCSSNIVHRLPCIWNSLPKMDLSLSTNTIKHNFMWDHFIQQFNDSNVHSLHHLCPCCHCSTASPSPIYEVLLWLITYNIINFVLCSESLAALTSGFQYNFMYWKIIKIKNLQCRENQIIYCP